MERLGFQPKSRKTYTAIKKANDCMKDGKRVLFITDDIAPIEIKVKMIEMGIDANQVDVVYSTCKDVVASILNSECETIILDIEECLDIPTITNKMVYLYYRI